MYKEKDTGAYAHDFRVGGIPRYHLSYGRVKKADADKLHAAATALFRARAVDVIEAMRGGRLTIEQVAQAHALGQPFASLLATVEAERPWPTLKDAAAQYVEGIRRNPQRAEKTATVVSEQLKRATAFFPADARLDAITSADVVAYQQHLQDAGLAVNTVTQYVARIGGLYRWHLKRETLAAHEAKRAPLSLWVPIDGEQISVAKTRRQRVLTEAEAQTLLEVTPAQLLAPVALGLFAGLRVSEMLHLRPALDVDLERWVVRVQVQPTWKPKTKRSVRTVPVADTLRPVLARHVEHYASEDWLVPSFSDPTEPMSRRMMDYHLRRIVENAELVAGRVDPNGITFHTLRHTFVSWLLMKGADVFTAAQLAGNSVQQIEETYGHLSHDHRTTAINRLSGAVALPTTKGE